MTASSVVNHPRMILGNARNRMTFTTDMIPHRISDHLTTSLTPSILFLPVS